MGMQDYNQATNAITASEGFPLGLKLAESKLMNEQSPCSVSPDSGFENPVTYQSLWAEGWIEIKGAEA